MPLSIPLPRAALVTGLFLYSAVVLNAARYDAVVFQQVDVKADVVFPLRCPAANGSHAAVDVAQPRLHQLP